MNRRTLFVTVAALLVLAFAGATMLYRNYQAGGDGAYPNGNQAVLERDDAPIKGPKDAKVTIVEFFDPACGTCRDFYPLVHRLIEEHPGKVRVMMRYAPLHQGSDQVVAMLEAARYQGKFWEALELLFANQARWVVNHRSQPTRALAVLGALKLDGDKFAADFKRPELAATIQRDVRDLQTLNVRATPEFFVNGRPMPSFGADQLRKLVEDAVDDAY